MFLDEVGTSEEEYILALRLTLQRSMIFLRQKPLEIWNNSFAKKISQLWRANIDAPFVLNAYATAMYCSSYMTKVDKKMTNTFKRIRNDHQKDSIDVI